MSEWGIVWFFVRWPLFIAVAFVIGAFVGASLPLGIGFSC